MKARKIRIAQKHNARSLVTKRLERVSKDVFKRYFNLITELVGNSPGIYALYDGNELYYVGKSAGLKKRVKQHLKDRHYASWTHFSLYLVRRSEHIHEIESLIVRIANPEGNRVMPRGKSSGQMLKELKSMIKERQREEFDEMFEVRSAKKRRAQNNHPKTLEGLVSKRAILYRAYKGKEYKTVLASKGTIRYANKTYTSPSGAAHAVVNRPVNGWYFWYIKDSNGDWVKLHKYKG